VVDPENPEDTKAASDPIRRFEIETEFRNRGVTKPKLTSIEISLDPIRFANSGARAESNKIVFAI
jgi:hypothetical protein